MEPIKKGSRRVMGMVIGAAALASLVATLLVVNPFGAGSSDAATSPPPRTGAFSVLGLGATETTVANLPAAAQQWLKVAAINPLVAVEGAGGSAGAQTPEAPSKVTTALGPDEQKLTFAALGDRVCFLDESVGAANCGGRSLVEQGDLFTATPAGCNFNVVGMMPDGVSSLSARSDSGQALPTVPVVSNVYSIVAPPENLTLTSQDGSVSVQVPLSVYAKEAGRC